MSFSLAFTHVGIHVTDMDRMVDFYSRVVGFAVSDRGPRLTGGGEIAFMTRDPREHHQLVLATGRPLSDWHRQNMPPGVAATNAAKIFLLVDRAELYRRIDARFNEMLASGALEEVRRLAARDLDPSLPAMKAHGVPWLIRHFKGEIDLAQAAAEAKRDTRRYTKRQETWFRNRFSSWPSATAETAESAL